MSYKNTNESIGRGVDRQSFEYNTNGNKIMDNKQFHCQHRVIDFLLFLYACKYVYIFKFNLLSTINDTEWKNNN